MNKVCIFCGKKPKRKNNEHVLPQWLIELTGEPNRIARFGYKKVGESVERKYSFNAFKFPSCESCNLSFAAIEATTKHIVRKILSDDYVSATEFSSLLDWFDKIRIGLWLSYLYLEKNPLGIMPKYYIEKRTGLFDRMLAIFKMQGNSKKLVFSGWNLPSFYYTPSCFALCINNYIFLNISLQFLFSRRIGFPYPVKSFIMEDSRLQCHVTKGRNRVMTPLLRKAFRFRGTELYQPMFAEHVHDPNLREYYDTPYVRENSLSWEQGIGKVFIQDNRRLREYPASPSKAWILGSNYQPEALIFEMQILTLEWQTYVDSLVPSLEKLPKEQKSEWKIRLNRIRSRNTETIKALRNNAQKRGIPSVYPL